MPASVERESSVESDRYLKHQHSSSSDIGRALVPMWDSSDPDRAPPPLPMNPSSPVVVSRPNTSSAIKSAHAALTEKARESAYMINPPLRNPEHSPERSLIKGAAHKRMQSLHTGSVRDMSSFLEGGSTFGGSTRSPERSPTRQSNSPRTSRELDIPYSPEKLERVEKDTVSRSATPTPTPTRSGRETPVREMSNVRPSLRRPQQSILSENGPPQSATMLALQNIATRDIDTSLSDVTNGSTAMVRAPQTLDALSIQILGITNIATSLQREMANLARRSKDNATDLVSLKEATNARDEDIRKSLRELVNNLSESTSRSSSSNIYDRGLFLDSKAHIHTPPPNSRSVKGFTLPRIPSPKSFASSLDRDSMASPASFMHDGGATIALLEKILRDMGTREGQEHLVGRLTEVADTLSREGLSTAKKLDELLQFVKKNAEPQVVVTQNIGGDSESRSRNFSFDEAPRLELEFDPPRQGPMTQRVNALLATGTKENARELSGSRGSDVLTEDILKIIRTVKDSVAQGGGITAEVKALVRELRGEVLGMGREIGRKLDESSKAQGLSADDAKAGSENVAHIVQDGLDKLKQQMDDIVRENRRQSAASLASRTAVDYQEIYNAVRTALTEKDQNEDAEPLEKEDIIEAVKEAWENYKPDIEIQQFGLERDELLACLKEGLQQYAPQETSRDVGASREEVFTAVVEGLKHFSPPKVETEASLSREEILDAVRECLEEFEFPSAPPQEPLGPELTRDDMLGAVREGLHTFDFNVNTAAAPPANDDAVTRDEILDAITEGIQSIDFSGVIPASREIDDGLTRDDVLDALKEGLESFDFAANAANTTALSRGVDDTITRHDVLEAVREGLESFDFPVTAATSRDIDDGLTRHDVLEALREGLESFEFPVTAAVSRDIDDNLTREDVLGALKEGLQSFDFAGNTASSTALSLGIEPALNRDDVYDAVKAVVRDTPLASGDIFQHALRQGLESFEFPVNAPVSRDMNETLSREDVLDALKEGLESFDFASNAANTTALSMGVTPSLNRDDVFDAVKASLRDAPAGEGFNQEVVDRLNEILVSIQTEFKAVSDEAKQNVAAHGRDTEQLLDATKDGFERLRAEIESYVDTAANVAAKDELLEMVRENFDALRTEMELLLAKDSSSSIEAVQGELEHLRETMATSLVRGGSSSYDKEEIMDAFKVGVETLRADIERPRPGDSSEKEEIIEAFKETIEVMRTEIALPRTDNTFEKEEIIEAFKEGVERLRADIERPRPGDASEKEEIIEAFKQTIETMRTEIALPHTDNTLEKEEIIEALKEGVESLRADIERPRAVDESVLSGTSEILDALHDGLNSLRTEVERFGNKPVDMTVNYEILDTLKLGMESLRADIDRLREDGYGDRAVAEINEGAVISAADALKRNDIENLEVLITQLRIKVEAFEAMPPPPPPMPEPNPDILSREHLAPVEEALRNVQESIAGISNQEREVNENDVTRADIEAIETLLHNTKAKLDEMDPSQTAKKDQLDLVEALILEAKEGLSGLATHLDDVVKKDDVNVVEVLVRDIALSLEAMREVATKDEDDGEKVTKIDVEAVEAVCLDIKVAIDQMLSSDLAILASKDDVKVLSGLVQEFKDQVDVHAELNAKSFEERQAETVGVGERVSEIKEFLEEFKDAMKEKLDEGSTSVDTLGKFLESLGETVTKSAGLTDDIKTLAEAMNNEFEKSNAGVVGSKLDNDEKFQKTWDTLDTLGTKSDGIKLKFEERFNELMTRIDEAQVAAEAKAAAGEEKTLETEATILGTKALAEELKSSIETLAVTLTESAEKSDESSKTVFSRIDQTFTRVEETHADAKAEHQLTREQVFKTLGAIEGVQGDVTEYNPKILESIKDVLLIVGQHYEHSKSSNTTLQQKIESIPPPAPEVDLPLLLQAAAPEKYDDAQVHQKLDKLVDHTHVAGKSFAQLDMLDKIHAQVIKTAAEVSEFVSNQTERIANDYEDKEKAVEAATIALEVRLSQKEAVENVVATLREEEELLRTSVATLKNEQESLAYQKMRLSADVSSLETALRIRREELQAMESRAEGLERRILEGVIDHSRALLISKQNKGRDAMSRKRVPSVANSIVSGASGVSRASYHTESAISMAMNGNRSIPTVPINHISTTNNLPAARRILSLNQITNNVPSGSSAFLSRSQSVKTPLANSKGLRKSSWGGSLRRSVGGGNKYGDLNKENLALKEMEGEEDLQVTDMTFAGETAVGVEESALVLDEDEGDEDRRESGGTTILTSVDDHGEEGTEYTGSYDSGDEYSDTETETDTRVSGSGVEMYDDDDDRESESEVGQQPLVLFQEAV